jgi:putative transposase
MLTEWKKTEELDFLNKVSCVPLQQCLRHLQTAYTNFFDGRAKYPNFKKKRNGGSAEFTRVSIKVQRWTSLPSKKHTSVTDSLEPDTT